MHCQIICHPSQLFLFLEELSNIIYSCLLTLTVVQNLVWSNQLNVSHFVIQCQLLPSHSPQIPCRPSKRVPSERLRLVKRFISHRLHTGACGNLVLLTYLLITPVQNGIINEWTGFINCEDKARLGGVLKKLQRSGFLPHNFQTFIQICEAVDAQLFSSINQSRHFERAS